MRAWRPGGRRGGDVERAMKIVLGELGKQARDTLDDRFVELCWRETLESAGPDRVLCEVLARWAEAGLRPLVLLLDEVGHPHR